MLEVALTVMAILDVPIMKAVTASRPCRAHSALHAAIARITPLPWGSGGGAGSGHDFHDLGRFERS